MECSTRIHLFILCLSLSLFSCFSLDATLSSLDLENPVLNVKPLPLPGDNSKHGSKDSLSCERIHIAGLSRLNLRKYASSIRFTLAPSVVIPEKLHSRIHVCLHGNASLGLCQCEKDDWRSVQKGVWSSMISPYGEQYVDVKFIGDISGSVTASIEEVFQPWRLICLAVGFVLLLAAPVLSSWVPFYYSSSMFIGVVLVVIILLFQGMKLLPTGRKNIFYITIYGSVLGAGSFLLHHFSMLVNSILVNFGLSEEMHNPVSVFLLLGIVLSGAALGYWIMRRFVISEDGSVDVGVAQFVKWAMRIVATTFILQSSSDTPLALATVALCWAAYSFIARLTRKADGKNLWRKSGQTTPNHRRAEFLRRRVMSSPQGKLWNSPGSASPFSPSPVKGLISPSPAKSTSSQKNYYSSFHKVAKRKKMTKTELEKLKRDTTREAMIQMASTPEFTDWIIEHADRIQILPEDSSDETIGSGSDSTDETAVVDRDVRGLFW